MTTKRATNEFRAIFQVDAGQGSWPLGVIATGRAQKGSATGAAAQVSWSSTAESG